MPQHTRGVAFKSGPYAQPQYGRAPEHKSDPSFARLARDCGEVVYFIRCRDGLIKIGYTNGHLDERRKARQVDWSDLLAVIPGNRDTECSYHVRFDAHLADGRERFYPVQEILDVVNEIRGSMGLSLLASF